VNGVASDALLRFRPQDLGVTEDQIPDWCPIAGQLLEPHSRYRREIASDLHGRIAV